jgi:hypothetical protein
MSDMELKTWYIKEKSLVPIILMSNSCISFSLIAFPFGVAVSVEPAAALIAVVCAIYCAIQFGPWESIWDLRLLKQMHDHCGRLLQRSKKVPKANKDS